MIDIKTLPIPELIDTLTYDEILAQLIQKAKIVLKASQNIDWVPVDSDDFTVILQAFAYRELHLRSDINERFKQLLLSYTSGNNLDHRALDYDIERLGGSKPYSDYEFSLSTALEIDTNIDANLVLTDELSQYEAILLNDVIIKAGELSAIGSVELQDEISSLDIKTEIITNSLPYVLKAKSLGPFINGDDIEKDEKLLYRILLSFADKSTAGSEESYTSYALKADARIEEIKVLRAMLNIQDYVPLLIGADESSIVNVLNNMYAALGMIEVYYYSSSSDDLMQSRIEEQLNAQKTRPLSDTVLVKPASIVNFLITAELKILPNQERVQIQSNAEESLSRGLIELRKIGENITLSEINKFLKVDGVKEVIISEPGQNILIANNQIGVNSGNNTITSSII